MRWFKVVFAKAGRIASCEEIPTPTEFMLDKHTVCIEASDENDAKKRAYNTYCAKKKKLAKERNYAAGNCACGRTQNRLRPDGKGYFKTCDVCKARQEAYDANYREKGLTARRKKDEPAKPRDEEARIEKCQTRMRDRRSEIRLEVLIEVRKKWQASHTVGKFTAWLEAEIKEELKPKFAENSS